MEVAEFEFPGNNDAIRNEVSRRLNANPRFHVPVALSDAELDALVDFVRDGLLDPATRPQYLRRLIPERLPSGRAPCRFEFP